MKYSFTLDFLKIVASFGIIWFHSPVEIHGKNIAYSGIIIFTIISIIFSQKKIDEYSFLWKKVKRLLFPWLFWSLIYLVYNIIAGKEFLLGNNFISSILIGTNIHLWFLPFIFTFIIISRYLLQIDSKALLYFLYILPIIGLSTVPFWKCLLIKLGPPWAQWTHALNAIFIGLFIGKINISDIRLKIKYILLISNLSILSIILIIFIQNGYREISISYLFGNFLTYIGFLFRNYIKIDVHKISNLTYGIYIIHPMVYAILKNFLFNNFNTVGLILSTYIISGIVINIISIISSKWSYRIV